jgi:hypothetical protein
MMFRAVQAFGEYAIGDLVDEAKVIEAEKLAGDVKTEIQGA